MTLTEQWKKGELPDGMYYMENTDGIIGIVGHSKVFPCYNVKQVLAPVPSYEEYSRLEWYAGCGPDRIVELNKENRQLRKFLEEFNALDVAKENQQLKELLYSLKCCLTSQNIEPQIRVEKSLAKIDEVLK